VSTADRRHPSSAVVGSSAGPTVVLVRYRQGVVGETSRTVHVVELSPAAAQAVAVRARCGAVLIPEDLELVTLGEGMPCLGCVLCCENPPVPS
jgi:hypothetical protein